MSTAAPMSGQRFTVSHLNEADFTTGGLRNYSAYRDLGIAAATNGLATAHVIRMIAPFTAELGERHHHNVQFQRIYVLKGWFKNEFAEHALRPASANPMQWIGLIFPTTQQLVELGYRTKSGTTE